MALRSAAGARQRTELVHYNPRGVFQKTLKLSLQHPVLACLAMPKTKRRRSLQKQAIREIRKFQDKGKFATKQLIAKSCFRRLARGIAAENSHGLRFREEALDGLQEAVETQIVRLLANANKIAVAEGRMTLQPKDMAIAKSIMEGSEINIPARESGLQDFTAEEAEAPDEDVDDDVDDDQEDNESDYVLVESV